MELKLDKYYVFKVWSLTLILAPAIFIIWSTGFHFDTAEIPGLIVLFLLLAGMTFLLSIPTLVLVHLLFTKIILQDYSKEIIRLFTIVACLIGMWITFILYFGTTKFRIDYPIAIINGMSIIISSFICKLSDFRA